MYVFQYCHLNMFALHAHFTIWNQGTREYNVGENPEANVLEVAEDLGLNIKDHIARLFDCASDVVEYD